MTVNGRNVTFSRLSDRDIVGIGDYLVRFTMHKPRKTVLMTKTDKNKVLTELPDLTLLPG